MISLEICDLIKSFGEKRGIFNLSLDLKKGQIFGLIGPDGAGKTTLIRMMAGVLCPDSGTVKIDGLNLVKDWDKVQKKIGYMSQKFGLYLDLTVGENMDFFTDIFMVPRKMGEKRGAQLLEMVDLLRFKGRKAMALSGGMKQKLALCCALIHSPSLLILDEPTNGVDPISRKDFWTLIKNFARDGTTVFISTSYIDEASYCDIIGLLSEGKLLKTGTLGDFQPSVEQVFVKMLEMKESKE